MRFIVLKFIFFGHFTNLTFPLVQMKLLINMKNKISVYRVSYLKRIILCEFLYADYNESTTNSDGLLYS